MPDKKQPIDWAAIEADYRKSPLSVKEIARWYGISDTAIHKRAAKEGWSRPPIAEGSRANRVEDDGPKIYVGTVLTPETANPEHIVERGRGLVLRMLDELDASTCRVGELEALIGGAYDEGDQAKAREAALAAISLKTRSEVLKSLATAAKTLGEAAAPSGVKAARQAAGERVSKGGGKFAAPAPPKLAVDNTRR